MKAILLMLVLVCLTLYVADAGKRPQTCGSLSLMYLNGDVLMNLKVIEGL